MIVPHARPGPGRRNPSHLVYTLCQYGLCRTLTNEIEHLKLLIAKLRRMQFGRKSEKLERQIEQLELKLEELETAKACRAASPAKSCCYSFPFSLTAMAKPASASLPEPPALVK